MQKAEKKRKKVQIIWTENTAVLITASSTTHKFVSSSPLRQIGSLLLKVWDLYVEACFKTLKTKADKFVLYITKLCINSKKERKNW